MRWLLALAMGMALGWRSRADGPLQEDHGTGDLLKTQEDEMLKLKNAMERMIKVPDPLHLPFLPTVAMMGMSLSLTRVTISGHSKANINVNLFHPLINVLIKMPSLVITADPYIAGGALNTLPFVGKDTFNATSLVLTIHLSYKRQPGTMFCAMKNSTIFDLFVTRLFVEFANLDPGSDSGDLINSMISANGPELMILFSNVLNDPQKLHPMVDGIVVAIINDICEEDDDEDRQYPKTNKSHDFGEVENERKVREKVKFVQEFIGSAIQESVRHLGSHSHSQS